MESENIIQIPAVCQINHTELIKFNEYEIAAATGRYIVVKVKYNGKVIKADISDDTVSFPTVSLPKCFIQV